MLLIALVVCWITPLTAQEDPAFEFIHATTDKPFYFERERLVFQLLALNGKDFKIVERNDVVHADLLNEDGKKIASKNFLWVNGIANGEFNLPYLPEEKSNLYLFVYCSSLVDENQWIQETLAIPLFKIPNSPLETNTLQAGVNAREASVEIYPDEEHIFNQLPNQVFFRIKDPISSARYQLVVSTGTRQDTVPLQGRTIGSFSLTPTPGQSCNLALLDDNTRISERDLKPSEGPGLTMEAESDSAGNLEIKLRHTYPDQRTVNIEITQSGLNAFRRSVVLNQPELTILVPSSPQAHNTAYAVSISDDKGKKLLQRLVFPEETRQQAGIKWINQREKLPPGSTPNLLFLVDRDSVEISNTFLSVRLMDRRLADVSGARHNTTGQTFYKFQLRKSGVFVDYLPVEFGTLTAREKEAWILTHPELIAYKQPVSVPDSVVLTPDLYRKGFHITGRITDKQTGEPIPYVPLALANTTSFSLFRFAKTNKDGYFKFENLLFEGENELFLAMQKYYDQEVNIEIHQPQPPEFDLREAKRKSPAATIDNPVLINEALERSIVDSVYTGTSDVVKVFQENNFISKIAGFFLEPTEIVDPMEYVPFNEMKDVFREILPSAFLRYKKKKPVIRMVHSSLQLPPNTVVTGLMHVPSLIIVDGVPIFNQEEVLKINPSYVAKYELYHGLFTLGSEVYLGLVHIVTNVDYLNKATVQGLVKFKYQGIAPPSSIAIGPKGEPTSPYLSPLGFWVSELNPDEKGVVQLPIRMTEVPGEYVLTLESVEPDGTGSVVQWPLLIE